MLSKSQVKYIQSLHQKKFRAISGAYIVEGPKISEECIAQAPGKVEYVAGLSEWMTGHSNILQQIPRERLFQVGAAELEKISALSTPNEVLVVLRKEEALDWVLPENAWCLALDGIQDPGNLGTIIRIADWFGVSYLLCSSECAELYNPKVIQASMGSFLRILPQYTDLVPWLSVQDRPVYAATLEGEPITRLREAAPGIILIGNESKGIRPEARALATREVTIPRIGAAESLNAAVATGILLSHFCNR
jgi:TrmH family RNA methyltransferase